MREQQQEDRFFQVPRTVQRTSEGLVDLPILYYDVSNVVALFEADLEGVREVLRGTGLVPGIVSRGRAMVGLSFYEYRRTSVGTYNEVGTAIFAVPAGERPPRLRLAEMMRPLRRRKLGAYVVDLPVTTAAANAAGREIWGYPKFITEIPFELRGRSFRCAVMDPDVPDQAICEIAGSMGAGVPAPPMSLLTYTQLEGQLIRTPIDVRGAVMARGPGELTLRVGPSEHRMARNLHTLGLDGAKPTVVMSTDRFQSKLHPGSRIG